MRYIKSFENDAAIQAAVDNKSLGKPYVALNEQTGEIDWDGKEPDYSKMYLTIKALETGTFYVRGANVGYSVNEAEWETTTGETALALNAGDTVRFKGTSSSATGIFQNNTITYNAYGNVESLHHGDDFSNVTQASSDSSLFAYSNIVSAGNLVLPATTLKSECYSMMFKECASLTSAPALPATTLKFACYDGMFQYCTSLTSAPELPATSLATSCYSSMFDGCTSLTSAPELPATTLVNSCYSGMFAACTNLNYVKCLATAISVYNCISLWLSGVASTGTFVKKSGVTWPTGNSGIPSGWTVIEE